MHCFYKYRHCWCNYQNYSLVPKASLYIYSCAPNSHFATAIARKVVRRRTCQIEFGTRTTNIKLLFKKRIQRLHALFANLFQCLDASTLCFDFFLFCWLLLSVVKWIVITSFAFLYSMNLQKIVLPLNCHHKTQCLAQRVTLCLARFVAWHSNLQSFFVYVAIARMRQFFVRVSKNSVQLLLETICKLFCPFYWYVFAQKLDCMQCKFGILIFYSIVIQ